MHEFNVCQVVVDTAIAELKRRTPPPKLIKATVMVGALRSVVPESLQFAYEVLTKDTIAEGSTLEILHTPGRGKCRACN